jgi:hypothetical protein
VAFGGVRASAGLLRREDRIKPGLQLKTERTG